MITKKEDLVNTYIVNDNGVLRDAYLDLCRKFKFIARNNNDWYNCEMVFVNGVRVDTVGIGHHNKCKKQLHLSDLISLENSKVYTTDQEVIRKYAELLGKNIRSGADINIDSEVKGCADGECSAFTFGDEWDDSYAKFDTRREITTNQINVLYAEKFGDGNNGKQLHEFPEFNVDEIATETPEEAEVFSKMNALCECEVTQPEWNGEGLPPVGVECEKIFDGKSEAVTPLYYDDHKAGMVMFYHIDSGKGVTTDYDWCLVENCIFRKPETVAQKLERERLESAYDLYAYAMGDIACDRDTFMIPSSVRDIWLKVVDKTNYRKESK